MNFISLYIFAPKVEGGYSPSFTNDVVFNFCGVFLGKCFLNIATTVNKYIFLFLKKWGWGTVPHCPHVPLLMSKRAYPKVGVDYSTEVLSDRIAK